MLALVALALTTAAVEPAPSAAAAKPPDHLKVLVLDVNSTDLTESERTTLTNLLAAHLGDDGRLEVLSGQDLKQLVTLQGQAQELGVSGHCTDACMAELAGALGAGIVIATQAGKLGDTLVVTLAIFDAAKAKSVSRKSITASSLGELPDKLAPALDALVRPLLPDTVSVRVASATSPPATTMNTTSPPSPPTTTTYVPPPSPSVPAVQTRVVAKPAPPPPPPEATPPPAAPAAPAASSSEDDTLWIVLVAVGVVVLVVLAVVAADPHAFD